MTAGPVSSRSRSIVPSAPCYACSPAQPAFANSDRSLDQIFPLLQSSRLINTFLRDYPFTPCDVTDRNIRRISAGTPVTKDLLQT